MMKVLTVELEDGDYIAGGYGLGITTYIKNDKDELYRSNVHRYQINLNNPVIEVIYCGHASDPYYSILKWETYRKKRLPLNPEK